MSKKPTGIVGPTKITALPNNQALKTHEKKSWPEDQKQIEDIISDIFVNEWRKLGVEISKDSGGTEDLDYLLTMPNKNKSYLELMEALTPLPGEKPFSPGTQTHHAKEYVDKIYGVIDKKTNLYGFKHLWPIEELSNHSWISLPSSEFEIFVGENKIEDK